MTEINAWLGTIFFPAFIMLLIIYSVQHTDLEDLREENRLVAECNQGWKERYFRELRLHEEWEHKYNQLLKNFQRYIDEHDNKQHHCNCCKKRDDEDQEEHNQHQCNHNIHLDFPSVKFTDELMGQLKQKMLESDVPVNNHMLPQEEREILKRIKEANDN